MKSKIANLWYYHKTVIILSVLILIAGVYLGIQKNSVPKPDYNIAIVEPDYSADVNFSALSTAIEQIGEDQNDDGEVTVKIAAFHIVLGAGNQDYNEIGALDADLTGKVSALFLLSDPEGFESAANEILRAEQCIPVRDIPTLAGIGLDDFYAAVREDHPQAPAYRKLTEPKI